MCIMGNGNDPPACIPSWKFPDENHESNKAKELLIFHGSFLNFCSSLQNYESCKSLAQQQKVLSLQT